MHSILLLAVETTKSKWDLRWLWMPQKYFVPLIFLVVIAFALFFYMRESRTASRFIKSVCAFMRTALFVLLLLLLFEPVWTMIETEVVPSTVVILIDDSLSMAFNDSYPDESKAAGLAEAAGIEREKVAGLSRLDLAKKILAKNKMLSGLAEKHTLVIYSFSNELTPQRKIALTEESNSGDGDKKDADEPEGHEKEEADITLAGVKAIGDSTRIYDNLQRAYYMNRRKKIAGMVILSDGCNNAGRKEYPKFLEGLKNRKVPVYTVGIGNPLPPRDIALDDLESNEIVIAGDIVEFKFLLKQSGYTGETLPVRLTFSTGGATREVQRDNYTLKEDPAGQRAVLRYKAADPGEYEVAVEADVLEGEQDITNNVRRTKLKVVDQKIRVLYIEGQPRWEYRYLMTALKRDSTMNVQCLLQSADTRFVQEHSPDVEPIVTFPTNRKDLFEYHVIIFGDVNPSPLFGSTLVAVLPEQLKWIQEFVRERRGGFLMIAGENYAPREYADGPIADILSVEFEKIPQSAESFAVRGPITEAYQPVPTSEGWASELLRLAPDPQQNRELWEDTDGSDNVFDADTLPGFYWYFPVKRAKPIATVLLEHSTDLNEETPGKPRVLLAWMNCGRGVSMFCGFDETWRWRAGVGDRYFYRFWGQAIRFLALRKLLGRTDRFSIETGKRLYTLGETVKIQGEFLDPNFNPETAETQEAMLERPDASKDSITLTKDPRRDGRYVGTMLAETAGDFTVAIEQGEKRMASANFTVEVPSREKQTRQLNEILLKHVAAKTDGEYLQVEKSGELDEKIKPIRRTLSKRRLIERVIDSNKLMILFIILFLGLITIEWVLRKRSKLL
ncbi:MAG: hypothetical protein ACYS8W_10665 [Planctomycetota bacterium]